MKFNIENIAEHLDPGDQLTAFVMNIRRRMQDVRQDVREALGEYNCDTGMSVCRECACSC